MMFNRVLPFRPRVLALAAVLSALPALALADERSDLEQLRSTTMALMQALIDNGLLSREKADEIVRQAQRGVAAPAAANQAAADKPKPALIRVPYVSETAKAEMRDEIKREVLAQSHNERWGEPGALPEWLRRINFEGDLRVRWQSDFFASSNIAPDAVSGYLLQSSNEVAWSPDLSNTQNDRDRMTLRARFGIKSELGEGFSAGLRLSTGNNSNPVAVSQTQGNSFNKYTVLIDQAYLRFEGDSGLSGAVGRFGNPFFGTDLSWPDDLNFDGVAASYKKAVGTDKSVFVTAGAFPLTELESSSQDKWLYGVQLGGALKLGDKTRLRLGVASYNFSGYEGQPDAGIPPSSDLRKARGYLSSEYAAGVRQKGNTLFRLNQNGSDTSTSVWGLASKFRPIDLTADLTFAQFDPFMVRVSLDYIKNYGFDLAEVRRRTAFGNSLDLAEQTAAFQAKLTVGAERIERRGQWQGMLAFRRMERDAWVDAFTDTTWNLGGTNYQGWSMGGQYGVGPRTSLGLRWTSTRNLPDPTLYNGAPGLSNYPLKIDVLQLELNSRF
ncbi:MAG: hypothetical protein EOP36_08760 [Rubrivivax sp.]|nr:MAG: hypothetical protein EOP36_08760 [Rubrivivax sp.]